MRLLLLIILLLLVIGSVPIYPYNATWGYYPFGGGALLLIIVMILLFRGY